MQIFVPTPAGYSPLLLDRPLALTADGRLVPAGEASLPPVGWLLPALGPHGLRRGVLLAAGDALLVNGRPPLPLAVLARGDEVRAGGLSLYFTDEAPLRVVPFDPAAWTGPKPSCSRCHRPLQAGEPVLFCPVCGLPYMAQPDKDPSCWTFGPCIGCQRDPHAEFLWQPDESAGQPARRRLFRLRSAPDPVAAAL